MHFNLSTALEYHAILQMYEMQKYMVISAKLLGNWAPNFGVLSVQVGHGMLSNFKQFIFICASTLPAALLMDTVENCP